MLVPPSFPVLIFSPLLPEESVAWTQGQLLSCSLNTTDLVALSGAHTFGRARCQSFTNRLYNFSGTGSPDQTLNSTYLETLSEICPQNGNSSVLTNFDPVTPTLLMQIISQIFKFRKACSKAIKAFQLAGLIPSTLSTTSALIRAHFESSWNPMIKMGNISPLTGTDGEID
ncbi:hypothetical protein DVH24_038078 [Malus domestica]|uniref:peroxidase n=1 Tax=Malus domestica TaxID=3750 RepID=A0A498KBQ4_MALDO|nr:hypothetical protein DVH24_038078 [Malus domestica]